MKKNLFKRGMAGLLSLVMCLTALVGIGTTTAYAAGERAEVYLVSFPRSGDANIDYSGTWGHPNLRYMNGWHSGASKYTTIRAMHSYDGNICYCIEPGVRQDTGDTYTSKDETFWDNLPSDINSTISPYDMKLFIGRIMQYGYTGPISTSWRSQNPADAATLAEAMATQVLIWETVVGERDEDFDYVSPGSYDAVKGVISTAHPLYDLFCDYYDSIEASVQRHSAIPSFMSKNPNRAQSVELEWDGSGYTATLTDHNRVLSDYNFSANEDGISFSVSGNQLELDQSLTSRDTINAKMRAILDEATDPWGIKVNRVELKNILPPREIQNAMEKQMKAERERRESILQAEGEKASKILVAEGEKQSAILKADAAKQARIMAAEAEATSIMKVQQALADAMRMLNENAPNDQVIKLKSLEALQKMADGKATKIIIPSEIQGLAGLAASAKTLLESDPPQE